MKQIIPFNSQMKWKEPSVTILLYRSTQYAWGMEYGPYGALHKKGIEKKGKFELCLIKFAKFVVLHVIEIRVAYLKF